MSWLGCTGRGVRVAVVDSGVNPAHPHLTGVAGGVAITAEGENGSYLDYLGHGTAVAAAICEKAPEMELYAVKIFDRTLATRIDRLIRALYWCASQRMVVVNLSIGTSNEAHRNALQHAVERLGTAGCAIVAAANTLPGALPGVIAVDADEDCPRDIYRVVGQQGRMVFRASRFPRPIPGQPVERNLQGVSFAVANMTGFVVRARQTIELGSLEATLAATAKSI